MASHNIKYICLEGSYRRLLHAVVFYYGCELGLASDITAAVRSIDLRGTISTTKQLQLPCLFVASTILFYRRMSVCQFHTIRLHKALLQSNNHLCKLSRCDKKSTTNFVAMKVLAKYEQRLCRLCMQVIKSTTSRTIHIDKFLGVETRLIECRFQPATRQAFLQAVAPCLRVSNAYPNATSFTMQVLFICMSCGTKDISTRTYETYVCLNYRKRCWEV